MKYIASIAILILAGFGLSYFVSSDKTEDEFEAAATIFPIYDLTRSVVGDAAPVHLVLEPGASPHTFESTPKKVLELASSDLVFVAGQDLDSWTEGLFPEDAREVDLSGSVELFRSTDEDEGEFNPHYWLAPSNAILMVDAIANELAAADPANASTYETNASNLKAELGVLSDKTQAAFQNLPSRSIATFHDAWPYFAAEYDLTVVAIFEPFPGAVPSPAEVAEYQQAVSEHNLMAIFSEPQLANDAIEQVAQDLGVSLAILDPLGGVENRLSYSDLIWYNVNIIYEALVPNN